MDNQELLQAMKAMIEPIQKNIADIKERTSRIEEHTNQIEERTNRIEEHTNQIEERTSRIEERTIRTEMILENDIRRELNLLGEGQQVVIEKFRQLDKLTEKVEDIQNTVEVLKAITVKK